MSIIYMIRHGQSQANLLRLWGGDFPLTELGRSQAATVAGRISDKPDKVVSSALKRAHETARIAYPDMDVEKNASFNEIEFGTQSLKTICDDEYWRLYCTDIEKLQKLIDGDDIIKRAAEAVAEMKSYAEQYKCVAIFTSDTILRNIVAYIKGQRPNDTCETYLGNCGIVKFSYDGELHIEDESEIKVRPVPGQFE